MEPIVNLYPPSDARSDYERVVGIIAKEMGVSPEVVKTSYNIMPHVVKMGAYLSPGSSDYTLFPRKGVDPAAPVDSVLLDQNDYFVCAGIGLRFSRADFASGVYSNHGNYIPLTFPDPGFFTYTGTAVGNETLGLNCIVNGTVSVKVAGTPMIDNLLASELTFRGDKSYTTSPVAYPTSGPTAGARGFFAQTPTLILNAMADNSIVLNLAPGAKLNIDGNISTGTTAATTRNIVYVLLNGWKIKNFANGGNQLGLRAC